MAFRNKTEEPEDVQMTFGEHLDELRKVLMHIGIAFVLLFIVLFTFFKGDIINIVFYPSESDFIAAMIGLTGICFGASAYFNKSNQSIAVGGGICVLSFLGIILGLFGNKIFVAVGIGVEAMSIFNYVSLFSLINTDSISEFSKYASGLGGSNSLMWVWEILILFAIGGIAALVGSIKFTKKDLPL